MDKTQLFRSGRALEAVRLPSAPLQPSRTGAVQNQMAEQTKYLIHVQCQPVPRGQESQLTAELAENFPVERCWTDRDWLTIEVVSGHRLAYGALKDLADTIQRCLSGRGSQLKAGVIHRTVLGPVAAAARPVIAALERRSVARPLLTGLLGRMAARIAGPARLVPEMYFHWGITLDLALTGRLNQTSSAR